MDNFCLARMYLDFLDTLQKKGELEGPLDSLLLCTTMAWFTKESVQQAMIVLRGELGSAMCRITTAQMGDGVFQFLLPPQDTESRLPRM